MPNNPPLILGIRHHSPACARLVATRIRQMRPDYVLIEGPADFNARLEELALPHRLPIAIYSYLSGEIDGEQRHHGSWSPFVEHSPEWQALCVAREVGAQVRFIDLPAWHEAFSDQENRYADETSLGDVYQQQLAQRLGVEQHDALWDQLFEDEQEIDELQQSLQQHFEFLRGDEIGSADNQAREQKMAEWIRWACEQSAKVLVICGGYHAPALQRLWPTFPACTQEPDTPIPPQQTVRYGSFLVPYSFKRLDAFTGYAAGMPSPAYYQWLWTHGHTGLAAQLFAAVLQRLRDKKLAVSTADLIALHTRAQGLARLRGHKQILRNDWLDALASALVKEALDAPLPWSYRGPIRAGTAPILVQAMDVLAGDRYGKLADTTPQPPLVSAFWAELKQAGITLEPLAKEYQLNLFDPADRQRSRLLHRAMLLALPGFVRQQGPQLALSGESDEHWLLSQPLEQHAALIEASAWGATLLDAARAKLEDLLIHTGGHIRPLAEVLNRAAFAGLPAVSAQVLQQLQQAIAQEPSFEALGGALGVLFTLLRHGQMLDMADAPILQTLIEAGIDRALWLFEPPVAIPPALMNEHVQACIALRQIAQDVLSGHPLQLEITRLCAVMQRKTQQAQATPVSRGAALGLLITLQQPNAPLALLTQLTPEQLGDALAGLLALARETLLHDPQFIQGLDQHLQTLDDTDFLNALPALRSAFTWLPTRERGNLAEQVLKLHQNDHLSRQTLLNLPHPAEWIAENRLREKQVWEWLEGWGVV